jgi:hypothetical protein
MCLLNKVFKSSIVKPVTAMEVGKERYAPQEVSEKDMKLKIFCQTIFILDPRRGDKRDTYYRGRW